MVYVGIFNETAEGIQKMKRNRSMNFAGYYQQASKVLREELTGDEFEEHYSNQKNDRTNDDEYDEDFEEDYPNGYEGEEDYLEEEEFFDDEEEMENFLKRFGKAFDYSKANLRQLKNAARELEFEYAQFVKYAKSGKLGQITERSKTPAPKKSQPEVSPAHPASNTMQRAKSTMEINKLTLTQHKDCKRTPAMVTQALVNEKKHINLVIVGHVDAGKSTLMGHILYLSGQVSKSQMAKIEKQSKAIGKEADSFAWIMAQDEQERARGVTIDVSMTEFETTNLNVTILDAPGHRDFVPNMIAGASQADAALLVVDIQNPLIDRGQAREHILLCRALGVNTFIVAINKMDFVSFDESAYLDLKDTLTKFLKSFGDANIVFVPTAASAGVNLKELSPKTPWYKGPTIVDAIDQLSPPLYDIEAPFLMCVNDSIDLNSREVTMTGKIESGYVCVSDNIKILPLNVIMRVTKLFVNEKPVPYATAGYIASITVATQFESTALSVGSAATSPEQQMETSDLITARIFTFAMDNPIMKGSTLVFHRHSIDTTVKVLGVLSRVNRQTKEVVQKNPRFISENSCADVYLKLDQPLPLETHQKSKTFGRFILRVNGETIGFGYVHQIHKKVDTT